MKRLILPMLAPIALAACNSGTEGNDNTTTAAPTASETPAPTPTATATPVATEIPAAIRGRWGLVPADCDPSRDDTKGLLTISADKLEFYESVGTLGAIEDAGPNRIRAAFDFEGEGMTWQRNMVLDVQDGGITLIRREYGEEAAPGPFRYAKCNQGN